MVRVLYVWVRNPFINNGVTIFTINMGTLVPNFERVPILFLVTLALCQLLSTILWTARIIFWSDYDVTLEKITHANWYQNKEVASLIVCNLNIGAWQTDKRTNILRQTNYCYNIIIQIVGIQCETLSLPQ